MMEYVLDLKVYSQDDATDATEIGEFITEVMNMELEKWGISFELIGCEIK